MNFQPHLRWYEVFRFQTFDEHGLEFSIDFLRTVTSTVILTDILIARSCLDHMNLLVPPLDQSHGFLSLYLIKCNSCDLFHGSTVFQIFVPDVIRLVDVVAHIEHPHHQSNQLQHRYSHQDHRQSSA